MSTMGLSKEEQEKEQWRHLGMILKDFRTELLKASKKPDIYKIEQAEAKALQLIMNLFNA